MKDLGLTMEHFKEHLMILCMDKKTVEAFDNIDSSTKAAFTRLFNSENKENLVGKKGKKTAETTKAAKPPADGGESDEEKENEEEEEEIGVGDQLIDEDQL
jgi:hypothetical protein